MKHKPGRGAEKSAIVIDLPAELKRLAEPLKALTKLVESKLRDTRGTHAVDYASIELEIEDAVGEIERQTHGALLLSLIHI